MATLQNEDKGTQCILREGELGGGQSHNKGHDILPKGTFELLFNRISIAAESKSCIEYGLSHALLLFCSAEVMAVYIVIRKSSNSRGSATHHK